MSKKIIAMIMLILICIPMLIEASAAIEVNATRNFSNTVAPDETFQVRIDAANMGAMGFSKEYLPIGFTFVNTSVDGGVVDIELNGKGFPIIGYTGSFTYNVTAPSATAQGFYAFNGTIQDENKNENITGGDKIIFVFSVSEPMHSNVSAIRTLPSSVKPGETFRVRIEATNMGTMGFVTEFLPPGFTFVNTSVEGGVEDVGHNGKGFPLMGNTCSFIYSVTAPLTEGTYPFNGSIQDENKNKKIIEGSRSINVIEGEAFSPCFIATAAYGTPLHEDIEVLRVFRDKVLMQTLPGRTLVTAYYSTSPTIANALRKNDGLRSAVRLLLITPLVYLTKMILNGIGLFALVLLGLGAFFGAMRGLKVVLNALGLGISTIVVLIGAVFTFGWLAYAYPVCAVIAACILPIIIPAAVGVMIFVLVKNRKTFIHHFPL